MAFGQGGHATFQQRGVAERNPSTCNPSRPLSTLDTPPTGERNGRIQRCATACVVYSDTACQGSVVKSSSDTTRAALSVVPPGASRSAGTRNEAVQQALPRATAPNMAPDQDPTTALGAKARECAYHDALIRHLDAQARQALPPGEQDRLRSERKAARDRQFALSC